MGVGVSLSKLASAVAREGAIGVIAAVGLCITDTGEHAAPAGPHIGSLRHEIRTSRRLTSGILGINIMVALTDYADMVKIAVEEGIDIIFSGAGLPMNLPGLIPAGATTRLAPIVSSARGAAIICKQWQKRHARLPDAIVVEGPLAGGHLGFPAELLDSPEHRLEKLVPEILAAIAPFEAEAGRPIPLIAGGGIYTGADIHRFIKLGAAGVQMGTRFVVTDECDADQRFKQAYINAGPADLTIIKSPVGMPGRAIANSFIASVQRGEKIPFGCPYKCIVTCDAKSSPYCIAAALLNARKGILDKGFAFAGANAFRCDRIMPVKQLIDTLVAEYETARQNA